VVHEVFASAPARADLAGGTLDIWPLYLLHSGSVTVNLAIDRRAQARIRAREGLWMRSRDLGVAACFDSVSSAAADARFALPGLLLEEIGVSGGVEIEMASAVPFGSGLGGSSALGIALAAAIARFAGVRLEESALIPLLRDVEARHLGKPTGVQDFYPAVYGGLEILNLRAGVITREDCSAALEALSPSLLFYDTRAAHASGMNNWEVFRRRLEGEESVRRGLEGVCRAANDMARAVRAGDVRSMGRAIAEEWEARRALAPVVSTSAIEDALLAARSAGAWGGKVCGAGGGGVIVMLAPAERIDEVRGALARRVDGELFSARPERRGLIVEEC
jgi:D-glycero-alpha-D-manno-heptose-7-phosphate kinase